MTGINDKKILKFVDCIQDFSEFSKEEQIIHFGYFLQTQEKITYFNNVEIEQCFEILSIPKPSNIISRLSKLAKKPKNLLVFIKKKGYQISYSKKKEIETSIHGSLPYITISQELNNLPKILSKVAEQKFLNEIITCYRSKSWRAVIVLMWILTMDHIQDYVMIKKNLTKFNTALQTNKKYQKITIKNKADFENVKESHFIEALRTAKFITGNQKKILDHKLQDRNSYAHPSTLSLKPSKALDFIDDLVNNILKVIK